MSWSKPIRWITFAALAACVVMFTSPATYAAPRKQQTKRARPEAAKRIVTEKSGSLTTREGLRLRLVTDLGNVVIRLADSAPPQVTYKVHIETDSDDAAAQGLVKQFSLSAASNPSGAQIIGQVPWHGFHGRLWVTYEVSIPRRYGLDITTQVGNIETQDVDGRVSLVTMGGNITTGRIGVSGPAGSAHPLLLQGSQVARLETQGGHISVQDVNGDLRAITAGGHINAGNVQGDAVLHTGGGNIRAGTIRGVAQLETGGGNISVQRAGGGVTATSAGGQIDFGEAAGSIRARTAGGAIRVLRVSGPMQLASNGGSIMLTQVRGDVHASTGAGNITAWFAPEPVGVTAWTATTGVAPVAATPFSTPSPSVAGGAPSAPTPRAGETKPAVKTLAPAAPSSAMAAPALAGWKLVGASQLEAAQGDIVVYVPRELAVTIEAIVEMGGENRIEADSSLPLKVKYVDSGSGAKSLHGECTMNGGGDVLRLKTTSGNIRLRVADTAAQEVLYRRQIEEMQRRLTLQAQRLVEQLAAGQPVLVQQAQEQMKQLALEQQRAVLAQQRTPPAQAQAPRDPGRTTFVWNWPPWADAFPSAVRVAPEEQQKRVVSTVRPIYPDIARESGVDGTVRMQVLIDKDGVVERIDFIGGPRILALAAMDAVKQWRYQPAIVDGKPVSVITTVAIQFKMD